MVIKEFIPAIVPFQTFTCYEVIDIAQSKPLFRERTFFTGKSNIRNQLKTNTYLINYGTSLSFIISYKSWVRKKTVL